MLVQIALTLTLLLAFCGLALDVGMMQLKKIQLQNAADAAALGAVYGASSGAGTNVWQSAGTADAALNGFSTANNPNVKVTFAYPPPADAGVGASNSSAVQATVVQTVNPIFFPGTQTITAHATAYAPYAGACLFLLSQYTHNYSLQVLTSIVTATCGAYLNLDFNVDNHSTATGGPVYIANNNAGNTGVLAPSPQFNTVTQNDPLAHLNQPTPGACLQNNLNINNASSYTLIPGTYCNNLQIQNSTVEMQPGLYIVTNNLNINNSTVTGTGVTIFMARTAQYANALANINNSTITLSAPMSTTGSSTDGIPGIVFFSDRNLNTGQNELQINNVYAASKLDGIIYAPGQQVQFVNTPEEGLSSTFQAKHYLGVVADQLYFTNSNVQFSSDYSSLPNGGPLQGLGISLVQ